MASDDFFSRSHSPFNNGPSLEPPAPTLRETLSAKGISDAQLRNIPDAIRRNLRNHAWSLIPNREISHFRYQHNAQLWVLGKKRWQQVSFSQFSTHTGERYAFVPYQSLQIEEQTSNAFGDGGIGGMTQGLGGIGSGRHSSNPLINNTTNTQARGTNPASHGQNQQPQGLTQAQINQRFLGGSVNPDEKPPLEPTVFIDTPNNGANIELADSSHVYMRFTQHTFVNGDTPASVTKQYTGKANPDLIYKYNYNEGIRRSSPPQTGDSVKVPSGWDTKVEGTVTNAHSVEVQWQGPSSGSTYISIPKQSPNRHSAWETRLTLDPGTYQLTAVAGAASHSIDIEVLGVASNDGWVKVQAYYEDKWQTPLPLQNVTVNINNAIHQRNIALTDTGSKSTISTTLEQATQTSDEAGVIVLEDLPDGDITISVERQAGLEREIQNLRDSLNMRLDGAYRATVNDMSGFQQEWDTYGYASIATAGAGGAWDGTKAWMNDQADLFEAETWDNLSSLVSKYAGKPYDALAEYAADTYNSIEQTVNDTVDYVQENPDNLTNWDWYAANAQTAIENAQQNINSSAESAQDYAVEAAEFLGSTAEDIQKLYIHRDAIMNLPNLITQGNAKAIQDFIDNELMDIDPDIAQAIKNGPNFHLVLELIEDNQAALIYMAYLSLFIEAIPPNFYAYINGKGGVYVAIEIILLIVMSLFTLGVGTAARMTTLAAKLAASSAKAAGASKKIDRAQQAISSVTRTLEDFMQSADTLKALGQKLMLARSVGLKKVSSTKSTLTATKQSKQRDTKCRLCGSTQHSTPRVLRGCIVVR